MGTSPSATDGSGSCYAGFPDRGRRQRAEQGRGPVCGRADKGPRAERRAGGPPAKGRDGVSRKDTGPNK